MSKIVISHMGTNPLAVKEFETLARVTVRSHLMEWPTAWNELLSVALFNQGPDLSQIGTTWLGSLCSMNALRSFTATQLKKFNAPDAFLPSLWDACSIPGDANIYAIPFTSDTRILLYRRDILAKCGIDESTAFQTAEHFYETLARLQSSGVQIPLAVSTTDEIHHFAAPWVWEAGGDYHAPDDFHLSLTDPRSIEGLYQFYRLHRFIPPQAQSLSVSECDALFRSGDAAVVYTVHNTLNTIVKYKNANVAVENIGTAKVPGVPYVGGSQLVFWKHSIEESSAIELIQYLTSEAYQLAQGHLVGNLPVLTEVLSKEPYKSDPLYKASADSLRTGRTIQVVPRWAAVEAQMIIVMKQLWQSVFANPEMDLRTEIVNRVIDVSKRLEKTILAE